MVRGGRAASPHLLGGGTALLDWPSPPWAKRVGTNDLAVAATSALPSKPWQKPARRKDEDNKDGEARHRRSKAGERGTGRLTLSPVL